MYQPFQVFLSKKNHIKSEIETQQHEDNEAIDKWNSLSNKKRLKFIKKAEKAYDEDNCADKKPFYQYVTFKELELLLKSYDMPERPPPNSKLYGIQKFQKSKRFECSEGNETFIKNEAIKQWDNLVEIDKKKILDEFHQIHNEYELKYVDFVRNLPQERVNDYKYYLSARKNFGSEKREKSNVTKVSSLDSSKQVKINKEKSLKNRDGFRLFVPHEIYYLKMKNDASDTGTTFNRSTNRSAYTTLSDKKKLRYIKKAEKNYDSYDFSKEEVKPRFSYFLSKQETELLLKSYGLPDLVPSSLSGFFFKKALNTTGNTNVKMEDVFRLYREMSAEEKNCLNLEHKQARKDYESQTQAFLDILPHSRLEDYNYFRFKSQKRCLQENGDKSTENDTKKKQKFS